jgi:hypothetical protein
LSQNILRALAGAEPAWRTPASLARQLGAELECVLDALAELDLAGLLSIWERTDDVAVTLSAPAARARSLRWVPTGKGGRWITRREPAQRDLGQATAAAR